MKYLAATLFDGQHLTHNTLVEVYDGRVVEVIKEPTPAQCVDAKDIPGILAPCFIDLQVNGGGGVMFNHAPNADTLHQMAKAHSCLGTGFILPTVITDNIETMERAADAISEVINIGRKANSNNAIVKGTQSKASEGDEINEQAASGVVGIHFEGPHISQPKKGVHPAEHVREMSERERILYQRTDLGIKKITLAPETVSNDDIEFLIKNNWIVSIGHSNAKAITVTRAIDSGASCFTHLFNAMSQMTGREPGAVGVALNAEHCYAGIIADGYHVDYLNIELAWKAKQVGEGKLFLVSDAMATIGSKDAHFDLFGVQVNANNGRLTTPDGTLAGAHLCLAQALKNITVHTSIPLSDALAMATRIPATLIGLDDQIGCIKPGSAARFVVLNAKTEVEAIF